MAHAPYATQAQIELAAGGPARLKEIADWDEDGTSDPAVISWAQLTADALIDGHATIRFLSLIEEGGTAAATATTLAANEAVYQLRSNRGQASEKDERDAAARLLLYQAIATGTFRPAEPDTTQSTAVASEYVERDSTGVGVSREGLKGIGW